MKAALAVLVVAAALFFGLDAVADQTQTRPDPVFPADSTTTLVFEVDTRHYVGGLAAGNALWGACQFTMPNATQSLASVADGRYEAVVQPALGEHGLERLVGCLGDLRIDHVRGHVVQVVSTT